MTLLQLGGVAIGAAAVDQLAKQAVRGMPVYKGDGTTFPTDAQRRDIPGGMILHVEHDGTQGSFGFVNRSPKWLRHAMFGVAPLVALGGWAAAGRTPLAAVGAGLLAGGALSNGIEHASRGTVTDQFAFYKGPFGIFNVADVAIGAGALTLGLAAFKAIRRG